MDTRIYVMTHKNIDKLPDDMYIPLHVGKKGKESLGYLGDDTGDEISGKNLHYCELTGMYWVWKNISCDIVGICHYRRFFLLDNELLKKSYIERQLEEYSIIIPNSRCVSGSEDAYSHYTERHYKKDLDLCRTVIGENYPEYLSAFDFTMRTVLISMGNMWITRKDIYDRYCGWLFDVLSEVENRLDMAGYDAYQQRVFGFLSERLFRVWLFMQKETVWEENVEQIDIEVLWKYKKLKELKEQERRGETVLQKKRLVFTVGVYDTLDLFTEELNRAFLNLGYETLILDVKNLQEDLGKLAQFIKEPVTAGIVFNNLGFNMELVEGQNLWEQLNIPCINILMDHPCFYHKALAEAPCNAVVLCTDQNHMKYVAQYYPNIPIAGYLPHAGCIHIKTYKKLIERSIDVLYAGGLSAYVNEGIRPDWSKYQKFDGKNLSEEIYQKLVKNPSMTTEAALEEWFAASGQEITEFRLLMTDMRYIEGLAVSYYRERTVKCLVESGINVTVYGVGWGECEWASNPNLNYGGRIPAKDVLEKMKDAKIVLSTMTWFKDGTHDRVFNGMLAGAVAVTDTSVYMKENFKDMQELPGEEGYSAADAELAFFELDDMQELPKKVRYLLENLQEAQKIADRGFRLASELHTWDVRAKEIEDALF